MSLPDKKKYPRAAALAVARELCAGLAPVCERLVVAGSLRRRKPLVGDVELLFVPKLAPGRADDLFEPAPPVDLAAAVIDRWLSEGILRKRPSVTGGTAWGPKNKLAWHVPGDMPVDLFSVTAEGWWSALVCRTGSKETNERIATAALDRGWHWRPFRGFERADGSLIVPESEAEVFAAVGLPYLEPRDR